MRHGWNRNVFNSVYGDINNNGLFCWDVGFHGHNAAGAKDKAWTAGEVTADGRHSPVRQVWCRLTRQEEMLLVAAPSDLRLLTSWWPMFSLLCCSTFMCTRWHTETGLSVALKVATVACIFTSFPNSFALCLDSKFLMKDACLLAFFQGQPG